MHLARLTTAVGILIAIAGGVFVVRAIASQWTDVRRSIDDANVAWLAAGGAIAALGMVAIALPWRRALALLGADVTFRATIVWYFVGEIGKYVPGGIWPVVGRAELVRRGGIPRPASYASVALSLGALYLAGMLVAAVLLPLRFLHGGATAWLWVLVLLPVGIALLHHRLLGWLVARAERLLKRDLPVVVPRWSSSLRLVLEYVPSWLLIGTATWCIARAFTAHASWLTIAPAAMISWVAGFVLVPVPGGIGVREAAFVALVGGGIPSGTRAAIAVTARLAFMLVDALGAGIGALWRAGPEPAVAGRATDGPPTREPALPPSSTAAGSTRP
ncbi:MAG TPA: lysylphosphatidylglycerol synthase transmembrane domain-containing protein [Acidimicrobiia bacterium]|nr:lysylphosphatidylglycerol synthase transmembrane domain-containing protein [Acidimicrobiia bacterium]